jgi:uncharacterized protein YidB (DUF937 family)
MTLLEKLESLSDEKNQAEIAPALNAVQGVLASQGGLEAVIEKLNTGGLGAIVSSWTGTGANQPVTPNQIHDALGDQHAEEIANNAGMPKHQLLSILAQELPSLIDSMTPSGSAQQGGFTNQALNLLKSHLQQNQSQT